MFFDHLGFVLIFQGVESAGAPDDINQAHLTQAWLATSEEAYAAFAVIQSFVCRF